MLWHCLLGLQNSCIQLSSGQSNWHLPLKVVKPAYINTTQSVSSGSSFSWEWEHQLSGYSSQEHRCRSWCHLPLLPSTAANPQVLPAVSTKCPSNLCSQRHISKCKVDHLPKPLQAILFSHSSNRHGPGDRHWKYKGESEKDKVPDLMEWIFC